MKGNVNGWVVLTIHSIRLIEDATEHDSKMQDHVAFYSQDARIHMHNHRIPEELKDAFAGAKPNFIYAVKFKDSEILDAKLLQKA